MSARSECSQQAFVASKFNSWTSFEEAHHNDRGMFIDRTIANVPQFGVVAGAR